jgi:hypothetical protein
MKLTRFSFSIFCIQYGRQCSVHKFLVSFFAILPMSSGTSCRIEASQDRANFFSSDKCSHSTLASILKTPTRVKQVIFSLHSAKAVGSAQTSIRNQSSRVETVASVTGKSSHRPSSAATDSSISRRRSTRFLHSKFQNHCAF